MQLFPHLSPDSNKIVFQSTDENTNILNSPLRIKSLIDNSETIQIAQNGGYPRWASNGESITFLSSQDNITNIWKVDPVTRKAIQITRNGISFEGYSRSPFNLLANPFSWAKTQKKIFYVSKQYGVFNIWSVDENGLNEQMLTKNEDKNFKYFSPTPSFDDSKIAFTFRIQSEPNKFKYGLAIISNNVIQNLYETDSLVRLLGWNGNKNELVVAEKNGKDVEIFKFSVAFNSKPISEAKLVGANIHGVALSPDLTKIAYPAGREGIDNIYIYSASEKENQLTSNLDESILFSGINWAYNGDKLFYSKQFGGFQISMITDTR